MAWNKEVPHILASGSSNGYTVVWDLRNRKELIKIPYPGGRKPVTAVSWNPDKVHVVSFKLYSAHLYLFASYLCAAYTNGDL